MRDFMQASLVSEMRNKIGDVLALPRWTTSFTDAVRRTEFAFFATLPPTVIYHHVCVWQVGQNHRQFGKIDLEFKTGGDMGVHDIVANCMSHRIFLVNVWIYIIEGLSTEYIYILYVCFILNSTS